MGLPRHHSRQPATHLRVEVSTGARYGFICGRGAWKTMDRCVAKRRVDVRRHHVDATRLASAPVGSSRRAARRRPVLGFQLLGRFLLGWRRRRRRRGSRHGCTAATLSSPAGYLCRLVRSGICDFGVQPPRRGTHFFLASGCGVCYLVFSLAPFSFPEDANGVDSARTGSSVSLFLAWLLQLAGYQRSLSVSLRCLPEDPLRLTTPADSASAARTSFFKSAVHRLQR